MARLHQVPLSSSCFWLRRNKNEGRPRGNEVTGNQTSLLFANFQARLCPSRGAWVIHIKLQLMVCSWVVPVIILRSCLRYINMGIFLITGKHGFVLMESANKPTIIFSSLSLYDFSLFLSLCRSVTAANWLVDNESLNCCILHILTCSHFEGLFIRWDTENMLCK